MPYAVMGLVAAQAESWEDAIAAFEKGLDADAPMQPEGELAHRSWRTYGYALLQAKKREYDERAVQALKSAIATADVLDGEQQVFAIYYNLACALSRLERVQEACRELEAALGRAKTRLGPRGFQGYLQGRVMRDPDLENVRGKPCFEEVIRRVTQGVATSPLDGI
jgi:tetratricopeptide (TPR) repeat protein